MAATAAAISSPSDAATGPKHGFLAWYRRYYLLVNLPLLMLILELVLVRVDLVHRWPFNEKDDLAKAFASYAAHPPALDAKVMLLLGNSATDRGFDPTRLEQAIGDPHLRIFNFGLKGARVDDERGLMEMLLARGIKPAYVVLGINTYLIDHKVASDTLYPWLVRTTPYVYFHRSRIRTKLWRWIKGMVGLERRREILALDNDIPDGRTPESAIRTFLEQFDQRPPEDFPMIDELPGFLDWLSQRGIRPMVVLLPMAGSGTSRMAAYDGVIAAIHAKVPPDALDLTHDRARFGDDLFYDVGHSNRAGRVALTEAVIPWLKQELARR